MKQKQYEIQIPEFETYRLPEIPEPYFWKLWCNGSNVAFLELRKKGKIFSKAIDGYSIIAGEFQDTVDKVEETAYDMMEQYMEQYLNTDKRED